MPESSGMEGDTRVGTGFRPEKDTADDSLGGYDWLLPSDSPLQQPLPLPDTPSLPPDPATHSDPVVLTPAPVTPAFFYCRKGNAGKRLYEFEVARALLGRSSSCDLIVEDRFAGRRHAEVIFQEGVWKLLDLSSANGTTVNDRRVGRDTPNPVVLCDGDVVIIGDTEFIFKQIV